MTTDLALRMGLARNVFMQVRGSQLDFRRSQSALSKGMASSVYQKPKIVELCSAGPNLVFVSKRGNS